MSSRGCMKLIKMRHYCVTIRMPSSKALNTTNARKNVAAAKSLQSCLTLCDPIDGSPPGSPIPGILQTRTLEWVAIAFSNAGKWKVKVKSLSRVRLLATPWTAAYQAPLSVGFSRQEYWSGVPLPSPERMWSNRNSHSLQVEMKNSTATLEDSVMVSYKSKHTLTKGSRW